MIHEAKISGRDSKSVKVVFALAMIFCAIFILARAYAIVWFLDGDVLKLDNDSVMRLVTVRSWLEGQPWFDTTEYRLMPPDGVNMHWSRYIDGILGGMMLLLGNFLPAAEAELWAVIIWPVFLSLVLLAVVGSGAYRLFGGVAASFAVLTATTWPVTQQFYFLPGKIDHHNVQIVAIVALTLLVIQPRNPQRSAALSGLIAAFALAIGLETLLFILALGLLLFIRANLVRFQQADRILTGFSGGLFFGSVLFWIGQTAPSDLTRPVCDQLGAPVVSLTLIAFVASVLPIAIAKERIALRWAIGLGTVLVGCAIAWPLLGPCLAGPYGALPDDVRRIIATGITEARPGLSFAAFNPALYFQIVAPVVGAILMGGMLFARRSARVERDSLGILILLAIVGFVASFSQVRLVLMSAPAVPLLVGCGMAALLQRYLRNRSLRDAGILLLVGVLVIAPVLLRDALNQTVFANSPSTAGRLDTDCRVAEDLAALDALEPSIFIGSLNLGPAILFATKHKTVSGPYHRSPDAFANGYTPFRLNEAEMRDWVMQTNATHLILCETSQYGEGFAQQLVEGASADWLIPIRLDAGALLVFEISS
ncbi:hypothetical protein [Yoonia litorea]|uniref:4-amino-4-deoxy-L-arabinose transferase n=1 Tax=Yoonia litorea TaxID=1123755 RepID=A0A1I6MUQ7_9RHOB|nr:hypothetical protein [Yoonia litorea]SFS19453.1 hypothetical protein SAMN05444714_2187 [Yoonia litorea]